MEAADGSANSKVIVQFFDPNGLFDDVAPLLRNRLPLGNLHWKSPTRPLRSIDELDISLDCEQSRVKDVATGIRRHQIPGLRQTPFVKVLLLRCDDKEKYKEPVRKEVKDWIKSLGVLTSGKPTSKGQERHDAFEYIILHVVLPGTIAASQPKSSKHISLEASESTDSVNSKSRWTGKGTSTILDKLKADFSSSSKAPFERVAQVRLTDPAKPSPALSPLELEEQWQEFIEKLKTAILQSFDARVAQYEDDIKERESQRGLPGWNFCTFFILKEGLARGFENVGLLEDAIRIYEELDLGLDAVIQDQAKQDYNDATNALLPFATDLKDTIRAVLDNQNGAICLGENEISVGLQGWTIAEVQRFPWKLERRNYQQMILTNQVSALDFRIYIFIRQMQIMLRQAGMSLPLSKSKSHRQSGPRWDADILSAVCERSIKFMNLAARNLRQDLFSAWGGQEGLPSDELETQKIAIDNIVASWKWSSILQTLSECQITISLSELSPGADLSFKNGAPSRFLNTTSSEAEPTNSTSVDAAEVGTSPYSGNDSETSTTGDIFSSLRIVKGSRTDLLFWSAELLMMLRTIFLQVCQTANTIPEAIKTSLSTSNSRRDIVANAGLRSPSLKSLVLSEESAVEAYKLLSIDACHCYMSSGKLSMSRQLLFDLAKLEMNLGNHDTAAAWLDAIPRFLESPPRTVMEQSMLLLYSECLFRANRDTDLVKCLLMCIQTEASDIRTSVNTGEILSKIQSIAKIKGDVALPFQSLLSIVSIDDHINYNSDAQGCGINLILCSVTSLRNLGTIRARLKCQSRTDIAPSVLTFTTESSSFLPDGLIKLTLRSNTSTEGWYDISFLEIFIGNLVLNQDLQRKSVSLDEEQSSEISPFRPISVYVYPRNGSPVLEASHSRFVDLSARKKVSFHVAWGENVIIAGQLRLKPATAGFRLDLASAVCTEGEPFQLIRVDDTHVLTFKAIGIDSYSVIEVPYSLDDTAVVSGSIRAEMRYSTNIGDHDMHANLTLMTFLPISVNVQDCIHTNATFSRFTFAPSRLVPISILNSQLEGASATKVLCGQPWTNPIDAYPKQPASWIVQIVNNDVLQTQLALRIDYRCFDEVVLETILHLFAKSINGSPYRYAARPLQAHLRHKLQTIWTEHDLELASLTAEIEMWNYEDLDWTMLLYAFDKVDRRGLEDWLRRWHIDQHSVVLQPSLVPVRKLQLLVDPPRTQVVITSKLKLIKPHLCIVGQPTLAQLEVSLVSHADINAEVMVEVSGQADMWLVGGQRRATFALVREGYQGTIVLIAQKTGTLLLPSIDVKCYDLSSKENNKMIAFELDNSSAATTVEVKSQIWSTTIGFGDGDTGENHWLIGGRRLPNEG